MATNKALDCALLQPDPSVVFLPEIVDVGPVQGASGCNLDEPVKKRGRATRLTYGRVVAVTSDDWIRIVADPPGFAHRNDANDGLFCWNGDSGSAIVNLRNEVVGLLLQGDLYYEDVGAPPTWGPGYHPWDPEKRKREEAKDDTEQRSHSPEAPRPPFAGIAWARLIQPILKAFDVDIAVP